jgi:hypothetical protein
MVMENGDALSSCSAEVDLEISWQSSPSFYVGPPGTRRHDHLRPSCPDDKLPE